jgi:hypothetical protein
MTVVADSGLSVVVLDTFHRLESSSDNRYMWSWKKRTFGEDFPKGFRAQLIGIDDAMAVAELTPHQIADHFRRNPFTAERLLTESLNKRYSPSTFITEQSNGYLVGWFSSRSGYLCQRQFSNLADAATDYLLFSLGKGRWAEPPGCIKAARERVGSRLFE